MKGQKMKTRAILMLLMVSLVGGVAAQSLHPADSLGLKKSSWNLNLGSSVGVNSRGASWINTYVAPQFNYTLNPKWSFGGGAVLSNTQIKSPLYYSNEQTTRNPSLGFSQSTVYAFGTYRPSERITVNALVYKSFDISDNSKVQSQINAFNTNVKGVMVNMNYKITEHSSVNIGLNYSDGGCNPFMQNTGMGGFGMGQQSRMFGW